MAFFASRQSASESQCKPDIIECKHMPVARGFGYARVSTRDQDLAAQHVELMAAVRQGVGTMRPKKHETTRESDLFRVRQIIDMKHELVQLARRPDWDWLDGEIAPHYSDKGRPGIETRFVIGLLLLKHIFALSDEEVPDLNPTQTYSCKLFLT
jgi:hypothetical protein